MNKQEKIKVILDNVAANHDEFHKQAFLKLIKQTKILVPREEYRELVSDVIFSIVEKLKTLKQINRFYNMCEQNKLKLYIFKAIDTNTRCYTSPFLQKKHKVLHRLSYSDNKLYEEIFLEDNKLYEEIFLEEDKNVVNIIFDMLKHPNAKRIFGEDWKYYVMIFSEYINDIDSTYTSLEKKYGLPSSTMSRHIGYVKSCIKKELIRLGLNKNN